MVFKYITYKLKLYFIVSFTQKNILGTLTIKVPFIIKSPFSVFRYFNYWFLSVFICGRQYHKIINHISVSKLSITWVLTSTQYMLGVFASHLPSGVAPFEFGVSKYFWMNKATRRQGHVQTVKFGDKSNYTARHRYCFI